MERCRFAVAGLSLRGTSLMRVANDPAKGWDLVMAADPSAEAREKFLEKNPGTEMVDSFDKLLDKNKIDAVFIVTPDYCHEEQAIAALKAGIAVYCEKPMAITIEGCDRMMRTAYETGSKLFIGHNMRYYPVVTKMKEIIDSGVIGEIQCGWCRHFVSYGGDAYFRDWHSEQKNTTGLLLQKGAHDIDVMHYCMSGSTSRVVGMGMLSVYDRCARRSEKEKGCAVWKDGQYPPLEQTGFSPVIDVEDHNMIMMQFSNGMQATYMQCHYTPDSERNYTFIGTKGRIENIGDHDNCQIHVWTSRTSRQTPDQIYYLRKTEGTHGGSDSLIVPSFFDFVMHDAKVHVSPVDARNAVAVGVLGHASMRNGNIPQDIPPVDPVLEEYFSKMVK